MIAGLAQSGGGSGGGIESRRHSVAVEGVGYVANMAKQQAEAQGAVGEMIFDVIVATGTSHDHKKKPVKLKVGGMAIQCLDGDKPLESWLYTQMSKWGVQTKNTKLSGKYNQVLTIRLMANAKGVMPVVEMYAKDAGAIGKAMMAHSKSYAGAKRAAMTRTSSTTAEDDEKDTI